MRRANTRPGALVGAMAPWLWAAALLLSPALPGAAEAFLDRARVLEVVPVPGPGPARGIDCDQGRSASWAEAHGDAAGSDALAAALREDLRRSGAATPGCAATGNQGTSAIAGYRVRYEYDGRVYERLMATDPGQWLRLRVRVAPAAVP